MNTEITDDKPVSEKLASLTTPEIRSVVRLDITDPKDRAKAIENLRKGNLVAAWFVEPWGVVVAQNNKSSSDEVLLENIANAEKIGTAKANKEGVVRKMFGMEGNPQKLEFKDGFITSEINSEGAKPAVTLGSVGKLMAMTNWDLLLDVVKDRYDNPESFDLTKDNVEKIIQKLLLEGIYVELPLLSSYAETMANWLPAEIDYNGNKKNLPTFIAYSPEGTYPHMMDIINELEEENITLIASSANPTGSPTFVGNDQEVVDLLSRNMPNQPTIVLDNLKLRKQMEKVRNQRGITPASGTIVSVIAHPALAEKKSGKYPLYKNNEGNFGLPVAVFRQGNSDLAGIIKEGKNEHLKFLLISPVKERKREGKEGKIERDFKYVEGVGDEKRDMSLTDEIKKLLGFKDEN